MQVNKDLCPIPSSGQLLPGGPFKSDRPVSSPERPSGGALFGAG